MKALVKGLEKFNKLTFAIEKWVLIAVVIVVVGVNFTQVLARYIFHYSIPWSEQLSVVLFMFMILIGGNIAIKEDGEIKIEIIRFKKPLADKRFRLIGDVIGTITLMLLFTGAVLMVRQGMRLPQSLSALPISYYHLYIMMAVGFGLMLIEKITNLFKKILFLLTKGEAGEEEVKE